MEIKDYDETQVANPQGTLRTSVVICEAEGCIVSEMPLPLLVMGLYS